MTFFNGTQKIFSRRLGTKPLTSIVVWTKKLISQNIYFLSSVSFSHSVLVWKEDEKMMTEFRFLSELCLLEMFEKDF